MFSMKTTRIAANNIGNKMLVQIASVYMSDGVAATLKARVRTVKRQCNGGNGALKQMGWPTWLWQDAKELLEGF